MIRLTNTPAALQADRTVAGASKTMMSPRFGAWNRYTIRFAITRSETCARQPSAGFPQCSVGSIEAVGIRYGFATSAWKMRIPNTATQSVSAQSINVRYGLGSLDRERSRMRMCFRMPAEEAVRSRKWGRTRRGSLELRTVRDAPVVGSIS